MPNNEQCPDCGSPRASEYGGDVTFDCGTVVPICEKKRQSQLCKINVKYNRLMKLSRAVIITVDADIEAKVPGTSDGTMHHINRLRKEVGL
jgi:hypothetical protein